MIAMAERIYVRVNSDFDSTGFMQPRSITWRDGRTFRIDRVADFRPASSVGRAFHGDCYTVIIQNERKYLFFERADSRYDNSVGRWFVEAPA